MTVTEAKYFQSQNLSKTLSHIIEKLGATHILHHSQLAVGAGSPIDLKAVSRLNKPALTHSGET